MSAHEMQHPDSPTWCIHCGTFDIYCGSMECVSDRGRRFDMSDPTTWERTATWFFGLRDTPESLRVREMPESQGVRKRP